MKKFLKKIFSLSRANGHFVLYILGIKLTFKNFLINPIEDCCRIPTLDYLREQNTNFHNPVGINIHPNVKIGRDCWIYQNVTIGCDEKSPENVPEIGNNVRIFANAVVFGKIKIGDNAKIGAGAVVFKDVPANATVVGNPARIIEK